MLLVLLFVHSPCLCPFLAVFSCFSVLAFPMAFSCPLSLAFFDMFRLRPVTHDVLFGLWFWRSLPSSLWPLVLAFATFPLAFPSGVPRDVLFGIQFWYSWPRSLWPLSLAFFGTLSLALVFAFPAALSLPPRSGLPCYVLFGLGFGVPFNVLFRHCSRPSLPPSLRPLVLASLTVFLLAFGFGLLCRVLFGLCP